MHTVQTHTDRQYTHTYTHTHTHTHTHAESVLGPNFGNLLVKAEFLNRLSFVSLAETVIASLIEEFPAFYKTGSFITARCTNFPNPEGKSQILWIQKDDTGKVYSEDPRRYSIKLSSRGDTAPRIKSFTTALQL
jgi:hypothetical protein